METISDSIVNMAKEEDDDNLPDKDAAKEFYAKYEPKEIIGRYVSANEGSMLFIVCRFCDTF